MCGFSLGMFFSSPRVIQDTEDFSNPKSSAGEIAIITPENKTYIEPDDGYYPGTYNFDNELPITYGTNTKFLDEYYGSSNYYWIRIAPVFQGHYNVLDMYDGQGGANTWGVHYFDEPHSSGTIEFHLIFTGRHESATRRHYLNFRATDNTIGFSVMLELHDGDIVYYNGSSWVEIITALDMEWYHHSMSFDCNAGTNGQFNWTVCDEQGNEIGRVENLEFENNLSTLGEIYMGTLVGDYGGGSLWDGFSFSWDPDYSIGDNKFEGLLLSYDTTEDLIWKGYSLDGQANKTILGNSTIPMPSDGPHTIQVFGNDTLGTMFESDVRHFTVDATPFINIITPENKTYNEPTSGYYPATYAFENDPDDSVPAGWSKVAASNTDFKIVSEWGGHKKLLEFYDNNQGSAAKAYQNWGVDKISGEIELWCGNDDSTELINLFVCDGNSDNSIFIQYVFGEFRYIDSSTHIIASGFDTNAMYHLKIRFDMAQGWDCEINGTSYGGNYAYNFRGSPTLMDSFQIWSGEWATGGYNMYVDDVAYSWDPNYNIGDNLKEGLFLSYDSNIDFIWTGYSLNGQANKTILENTTIPMPSDGQHRIQVFGNDSIDNMYESEVRYFEVDINPVDITIISPANFELFQDTAPDFEISIDDPDLNSMWYSLDGGLTTIPFTGFTGTIEQSEWNKISNGTVTIGFYANDSANNIGYASVTVRKDVLGPIITVNSPQSDDVIGINAPNYDISIEEFHLDSMWYSLDYGVTVFPIFFLTGTLDQAEWDSKGGGTVPIRFYANDSLGHESFTDILVAKDLIFPIITINSPNTGEVFGATSPTYDISISESNLDSYWYTIDGGAINITISSLTGTINQAEWDKQGNGTITIRFFAEDEGDNKASSEVIVRKDINVPLITIISPDMSDVVGINAPGFELSVVEPNLDSVWYTLDDGVTNYPIIGLIGTIDSTEWGKFGEGMTVIKFYAEDMAGNLAFAEVQVEKDLTAPLITIDQPEMGDIFVSYPPIYSISIDELHSYEYWYSLDNGAHNYTITELFGSINQSSWDAISNGHVTLRFYAEDEAGNIGESSVLITKDAAGPPPTPPGIPGYDLYILLGALGVIFAILIRKRLKS